MEQSSEPSNLIAESPPPIALPLELMTPPRTPSPIMQTGENASNLILMPSVSPSLPKNEINSVKPLPNLKSNVKPHELREKQQPEPRVLKVRKEDIIALCQVITEFQDQFTNY